MRTTRVFTTLVGLASAAFAAFAAFVSFVPFVSFVVAAQPPPDRSKPPQIGQPRDLKLAPVQKQKLSNGLSVWIVELHKVPVAQVNLLILSGSADDPPRPAPRRVQSACRPGR